MLPNVPKLSAKNCRIQVSMIMNPLNKSQFCLSTFVNYITTEESYSVRIFLQSC